MKYITLFILCLSSYTSFSKDGDFSLHNTFAKQTISKEMCIRDRPGKDVYTYLAERKGMTVEQSKQMHKQVVQMAAGEGLQYNFDKAVIANSFDAHRISHLAKKHGKGDAMEEQLFRGYFTAVSYTHLDVYKRQIEN